MSIDYGDLENQYGLPTGLLSAVKQQESGGDPNAVSSKGAVGAFQFEPATAKQYGIDPTDPDQAAQGAAMMFGDLSKKYNGDVPSMLAAYNWGQGNVDRKGLENAPEETQNYINSIVPKLGGGLPQGTQYAAADTGNMSDATVDNISISDLSKMSDAELDALEARAKGTPDLSKMSDMELDDLEAKLKGGQQQSGSLIDALKNANNDPRAAYQATMNTVAKPINTTINKVVSPVMGTVASATAPAAQGTANAIDSTGAGQWLGDKLLGAKNAISGEAADIGANIKDLESYNPDLEKDLSAFGQNAELAGNLTAVKPVGEFTGSVIGKTGEALTDAGAAQAAARKSGFVQDLITPKVTPAVAADQFSRSTEQGLLRNRVVTPTPQEMEITNTVSQLPVSPNKSMLANYNIISDANNKEATDLISKLKANNAPIDLGDVQNTISNTVDELRKNPFVTGDGENAALKVVNVMNKAILDNTPANGIPMASDLLQARKDFDAMIKAQKGGKMFDPALDSPTSIAIQNMRQSINNLIESKVPNADFKASLQKQSNLYRAMDNIETKGGAEPSNIIKRGAEKIANIIPGKTLLTKGAAIAIPAAGAVASPIAAGTALAGYGGYKALASPITKKIIGSTLQGAGTVLGHKEGGIIKNREIHLSKKLEVKLGRKPKAREVELATYVGVHGVHRLLNQKDISMPAHKMFPETTVKQKRELFFNKKKPYTVEHIQKTLG